MRHWLRERIGASISSTARFTRPVLALTGSPRSLLQPGRYNVSRESLRRAADRKPGRGLVHPAPGLATAEHSAKGTALNPQGVRALQRDRRIIGAAALRVVNSAAPFGVLARLHIDQDLFAVLVGFGVHGISAEIGAALLDPDLAFLFFRHPHAERCICRLNPRGRGLRRRCRGRSGRNDRRRFGLGGGGSILLKRTSVGWRLY